MTIWYLEEDVFDDLQILPFHRESLEVEEESKRSRLRPKDMQRPIETRHQTQDEDY